MPSLYYIADPMCSWCWGFASVLDRIESELLALPEADRPAFQLIMGGLAKDSEEPMPQQTRDYIQNAWRSVEAETGASFNWDFWEKCSPRRSTYPSCRAVLSAAKQFDEAGPEMFRAIQKGYYQEARNPSEIDTLVAIASEIASPIHVDRFASDLVSQQIDDRLHEDFGVRSRLGVREFPSMILERDGEQVTIVRGYAVEETALGRLKDALNPE
jgi:putative protein-disulfide isomerase